MTDSSSAILVYEKKVLLILRDDDTELRDPNCWALVGGGVEEGETFIEAVRREMKEEISVVPSSIIFLGKAKTPDGFVNAIYYSEMSHKEVSKIVLGDEGQALKFWKVEELSNIKLAENLALYYKMSKDYLIDTINKNKIPDPAKIELTP